MSNSVPIIPLLTGIKGMLYKQANEIDDGNYVMVHQKSNDEWVVLSCPVSHGLLKEPETNLLGRSGNTYEDIRKTFRTALEYDPTQIIMILEGSASLKYMEKPMTDHFGAKAFTMHPPVDSADFPKHDY